MNNKNRSEELIIRRAQLSDLKDIMPVFACARRFMAQTGCPYGTGTGGSGKKLKAEFNTRPHKRGTVSMARSMVPDSADSQFFICFGDCDWLNGQYTVWGEVTSGMEYVDNIKRGDGPNGMVSNPDEIISMQIIADI